ncbi:MAG: type II toxin-antitoxin system HipA family toxin [Terracidiphilus sp.]|nr:type II toxin-antitoxin system HipA family toxin [Terracidiphilus sp.]MDR3775456.1 type II toxin-antitoxin system HipA family toxin [Terracidiphilus sp.]
MNFDTKMLNSLAVSLHGRRIGVINRLGGDCHLLSFEQDYLDDANRPTLSLSFKGQAGGLVIPTRAVTTRLPVFFSNLLPEGHLREYLAVRAGVKAQREFFLLAVLGADLPGALTVVPMEQTAHPSAEVAADQSHHEGEPEAALRFSLAGVQLKFSAVMEASGGLTIPAGGMGGSWIVKLPSSRFASVPENEYTMLALARAVGIEVPNTELIDIRDIRGLPADAGAMEGKALAVQRFDRGAKGEAIHMEDFAQVFGLYPDDKYHHRSYANIAAVLWAETGEAGTYEFFRRLVFSVLIGNGDMHLKNWSLLYPDRRTPVLSPAYDFVATFPYIPNDSLALSFGGSRSLSEIGTDQVRRFADTARLPASPLWTIVTDITDRTVAAWKRLPEKDLLSKKMRKAIGEQILTVAKSAGQNQ